VFCRSKTKTSTNAGLPIAIVSRTRRLNSEERLTSPMLKQGGQWTEVDWQTALEYVANGLRCIRKSTAPAEHWRPGQSAQHAGRAVSGRALVRGLGSSNIDHRLRHADFTAPEGVRWLGRSIASLSTLQSVLVVGSNLRKDHPLFAQRIRQAARKGCTVMSIECSGA
jgi:NADH-quinone oxidoreductase subunit G